MKIIQSTRSLVSEYRDLSKETSKQVSNANIAHAPPEYLAVNPYADQLHQLKKPPVYFVNAQNAAFPAVTKKITSKSHGYAVIGNPGKGQKSGAAYFGIQHDWKRGSVDINKALIKKINERSITGQHKFENAVRNTVKKLKGNHYPSREAFYDAYRAARAESESDVTIETINKEIRGLFRLLTPQNKCELWPHEPNGYKNQKPNDAEKDIRRFENIGGKEKFSGKKIKELADKVMLSGDLLVFDEVSFRHVPDVNAISLIEAKQQLLLQRSYIDEVYGRNGTGFPTTIFQDNEASEPSSSNIPIDSPQKLTVTQIANMNSNILARMALNIPRYHRLPPFNSAQGNCNAGSASLLRSAMNRNVENADQRFKAASATAFGFHHQVTMWDPIAINNISGSEE